MSTARAGAALVTGAGKRIGKSIAIALANAGYDIAVHFHTSKDEADLVAGEISAAGRKAVAIRANLSNEDETAGLVERCRDAIGPLNVLVNSASVFEHDDIKSLSRRSWDRHIETNLRAPLKLSQEFAKQAPDDGNNNIINVIDQRVLKLTPQFLSYTTSKAALHTLTLTLAQALGPDGIRVNAIAPGPVLKNSRQSDHDWRQQNEATVLGRGGTLDDLCAALRFLVETLSVTGQTITIDGGQHLAWQTPDVLVQE